MIAAWMLFATIVGALLVAAAIAAEPLVAARGLPRRAVWTVTLMLAVVWPAAIGLAKVLLPEARDTPIALSPFTISATRASEYWRRAPTDVTRRIDAVLLAGWLAATLLLLVRLAAGRRSLERRRQEWDADSIDGVPVRLSTDVGPAVVGLRPMEIVLPRWALSLDQPLRALVLRHEEEHRLARDPQLLLLSAIALALMPWNLALWWHARRLRLAIEVDCDSRVLRAHPRRERYGLLLLAIAQRRDAAPHLAPALSEPVSQLERRIDAMSPTTITRTRFVASAFIAIAAVAVACSVESPTRGPDPRATGAQPTFAPAGTKFFEFQVERRATPLPNNRGPRYPDALRAAKVEGEVLAQFVVGPDGRVDIGTFKVLRSADPRFTEEVKSALVDFRFSPAMVGNKPVRQLIQMPFQFSLGK